MMLIAVVVQRLPFDVFHDEVGQSIAGCASVQQAGDVRMIQSGQNLALGAKTAQDEVRIHAALDQFDRDALVELLVNADRFINSAHTAAANLALDTIGAK